MTSAADLAARAVAVTLAAAGRVGRALRAEGGAAAVARGVEALGRADVGALVARACAFAVLAQRAVAVRGAAHPGGPWCAQQRAAAALVLLLMMRQRRALPERAGGGIAFVDMRTRMGVAWIDSCSTGKGRLPEKWRSTSCTS